MQTIESPARRYITGKLPSHAELKTLHEQFSEMPAVVVEQVLKGKGYLSETGAPTKRALAAKVLDVCDKRFLWRIEAVEETLRSAGLTPKRVYGNQKIDPPTSSDPTWVNLTTLATYFNVTAPAVGRWLDELELREDDGLPTKDAQDRGLGYVSEMAAGKKKTRKIAMWESYQTRLMLRDAGHPLDFDYMKSLEAKGKNSAIKVETLDSRTEDFTRGFVAAFKTGSKEQTKAHVGKTPRAILGRAEKLLKKPEGWISNGKYLERLR